MASNDRIILDQVLDQQRSQRAPHMSPHEFFEVFVAEQVLKDYDLSDEEIASGVVGNGGDGGVDGIYVFANGELVHEDFDPSALKRNVTVEVVVIQAKTSASFDEEAVHKLAAVSADLFDLSTPPDKFRTVYNADLRAAAESFHTLYKELAARFPDLRFRYVYATKGDGSQVHPNVARKQDAVCEVINEHFSNAQCSVDFLGADGLLKLARRQPATSAQLNVAETISAEGGYIALVKLRDFNAFIVDEAGQLRKHLFEANVRDFQGATQVNEEIQHSLVERGPDDFWWLNNGVTILGRKAVLSSKTITIEDPQIVNGLQTSTQVSCYFRSANTEGDERSVMVRVIEVQTPEVRDRIIKATNSQTPIPPASLRATDKVHRDIEEYLKPFGLYYDRRKNSHKNEGRPVEQIISIPLMAQAVMAIALQRPGDARGRPSSLIKKDDDYAKLFAPSHPVHLYLVAGRMIKAVRATLRGREDLSPQERNDLLFHVAMDASARLAGNARPSAAEIASLNPDSGWEATINDSVNRVEALYRALGGNEQVAKGTQLAQRIQAALTDDLS
jgi:hypothetical protein